MPVFAYSISADQYHPSEGDGFVRADTAEQAVALIGHPGTAESRFSMDS